MAVLFIYFGCDGKEEICDDNARRSVFRDGVMMMMMMIVKRDRQTTGLHRTGKGR